MLAQTAIAGDYYSVAYNWAYKAEIQSNTGGQEKAKGMPCDPEGVLNQPLWEALVNQMIHKHNLSSAAATDFRRGFRQGFIDAYKANYKR